MNAETDQKIQLKTETMAARTFRVWELTAIYRLIGLEPAAARNAAIADLQIMFPASFAQLREAVA
jgi:hypothetical protein